jgi:glutamine synthetase
MELLIADLAGVLRGKRIRRKEFEKTFTDGFSLPGGAVLLNTLGDVVPDIPWSGDDGDPDANASIVPGSLSAVPWAQRPQPHLSARWA